MTAGLLEEKVATLNMGWTITPVRQRPGYSVKCCTASVRKGLDYCDNDDQVAKKCKYGKTSVDSYEYHII